MVSSRAARCVVIGHDTGFNEELVQILEGAVGSDLTALHLLNLLKRALENNISPEARVMAQSALDDLLRELTPPPEDNSKGPYR